ncbi:DUF2934 domain-containing protein [Aureimonas sp. AU22]|jgi:hypothetical protein|uniref:DUF2934 domain-containing protein n=1 Tax=Aureimonas sp. AU22 TaxID=1638162 RepID=UPI0009E664F1|nr:DUF2934 domain-containing protein [Aureimonas sp. AU22]
MSTTLDEDRVRQKAQEIWESEGRPEGRAESHWLQAREIVALKDSYGATLTPVDETLEDKPEPAVAFENQGEFPELTDIGEGARGPSWQAARETTGANDDDADPDNTVPSQGTRA